MKRNEKRSAKNKALFMNKTKEQHSMIFKISHLMTEYVYSASANKAHLATDKWHKLLENDTRWNSFNEQEQEELLDLGLKHLLFRICTGYKISVTFNGLYFFLDKKNQSHLNDSMKTLIVQL